MLIFDKHPDFYLTKFDSLGIAVVGHIPPFTGNPDEPKILIGAYFNTVVKLGFAGVVPFVCKSKIKGKGLTNESITDQRRLQAWTRWRRQKSC
jgi:hypothetical protein